jgi:hypothetical protein
MPKLGSGETDHAKLDHLLMADSGHAGFASASHEADHRDGGADAIAGALAVVAIPRVRTQNDADVAEEITQQGAGGGLSIVANNTGSQALLVDGRAGYEAIAIKAGGVKYGYLKPDSGKLKLASDNSRDLVLSAASGCYIDVQKAIYNSTSNNSGRVLISDDLQYTGKLYPGTTADGTTPGNCVKKITVNIGGVDYYLAAYDAIT